MLFSKFVLVRDAYMYVFIHTRVFLSYWYCDDSLAHPNVGGEKELIINQVSEMQCSEFSAIF